MSDEDRQANTSPVAQQMSRRDALRLARNTAVATAAAGALGLTASEAEALAGPPLARMPEVATPFDATGPRIRPASGSADLLVRDGTPHSWMSPDIWVVPGTDPSGAPGSPVAGDVAYVWARVANTGKQDAVGVKVRFYWANPAFQMYYSGINLIGSALADIPAGETQDVLCLVPWNVVVVNGGHECLVVVASMPDGPPLPDLVDPPAYPQVAQRNLTVLSALRKPDRDSRLMLTVTAPPRVGKAVNITWEQGKELTEETLKRYGLTKKRPAKQPVVEIGFSLTDPKDGIGEPRLDLDVPAGRSKPIYTTVRGAHKLKDDEYQVVHVREHQSGELLGGVSFIVTAQEARGL
jgi:hypothetical protein